MPGPKNFTRSGIGPTPRLGRARASRAATPRMNLGKASAGVGRIPGGGGSGIAKATTPMATAPRRVINKPHTGGPSRGLGKPKADFPSKI